MLVLKSFAVVGVLCLAAFALETYLFYRERKRFERARDKYHKGGY